ncbi:hypothetical protein JL722_11044 [Aureococcus anophagefferens]|nr:hypothetical protein JL722_11044 [Aureococcus anophagefferens]
MFPGRDKSGFVGPGLVADWQPRSLFDNAGWHLSYFPRAAAEVDEPGRLRLVAASLERKLAHHGHRERYAALGHSVQEIELRCREDRAADEGADLDAGTTRASVSQWTASYAPRGPAPRGLPAWHRAPPVDVVEYEISVDGADRDYWLARAGDVAERRAIAAAASRVCCHLWYHEPFCVDNVAAHLRQSAARLHSAGAGARAPLEARRAATLAPGRGGRRRRGGGRPDPDGGSTAFALDPAAPAADAARAACDAWMGPGAAEADGRCADALAGDALRTFREQDRLDAARARHAPRLFAALASRRANRGGAAGGAGLAGPRPGATSGRRGRRAAVEVLERAARRALERRGCGADCGPGASLDSCDWVDGCDAPPLRTPPSRRRWRGPAARRDGVGRAGDVDRGHAAAAAAVAVGATRVAATPRRRRCAAAPRRRRRRATRPTRSRRCSRGSTAGSGAPRPSPCSGAARTRAAARTLAAPGRGRAASAAPLRSRELRLTAAGAAALGDHAGVAVADFGDAAACKAAAAGVARARRRAPGGAAARRVLRRALVAGAAANAALVHDPLAHASLYGAKFAAPQFLLFYDDASQARGEAFARDHAGAWARRRDADRWPVLRRCPATSPYLRRRAGGGAPLVRYAGSASARGRAPSCVAARVGTLKER